METTANELRVVDLADEFAISISETLALCEMFSIPAPYGSSVLSPEAAELLRGLARGDIDPENADQNLIDAARAEGAAPPPPPPVEDDFADLRTVLTEDDDLDDSDYSEDDTVEPSGNYPADESTMRADLASATDSSRQKEPSEAPTPVRPLAKRSTATRQPREPTRASTTEYEPGKPLAAYDDIDKYIPRWLRYVSAVVLVVVGVLVYRQLFVGGETAEVAGGVSQEPVFDAGECFVADPSLWIDTIQLVPCAGEHDGEVFDSIVLSGTEAAPYPDESDMRSQARQACRGTFVSYTGESSIVSDFDIGISIPSASEWLRGGRLAYCSIVSPDGIQLVGSAQR